MGQGKSIQQYNYDQIDHKHAIAMLRAVVFDPDTCLGEGATTDEMTKLHQLSQTPKSWPRGNVGPAIQKSASELGYEKINKDQGIGGGQNFDEDDEEEDDRPKLEVLEDKSNHQDSNKQGNTGDEMT